jgi:hypothetical protein
VGGLQALIWSRLRAITERIRVPSLQGTVASFVLLLVSLPLAAQTAPPAPTITEPSNGAALVQPITLAWNPVVDPDGPIGSYTWQVGTSSTFGTIIASAFQNMISDTMPAPTQDKVSGLPNGTYFWRVRAIHGNVVWPWSLRLAASP